MIVPKVSPRGIDWPFQVRAYGHAVQKTGSLDSYRECKCDWPLAPWEFLEAVGTNPTVRPTVLVCYFVIQFPDRLRGIELPIYCNYDFHHTSRSQWESVLNEKCTAFGKQILLRFLDSEQKHLARESRMFAQNAEKLKDVINSCDESSPMFAEPQLRRALKR